MERSKTRDELLLENEELRARLDEAEETLRAIRSGEVDALLTEGPEGDQVFTLRGAEQPYRIFVETMGEGAATLTQDETVLFCNNRFAEILKRPLHRIMGAHFSQFVSSGDRPLFRQMLEARDEDRKELMLEAGDGTAVPVYISGRTASFDGTDVICMVVTDLTAQKETYARQARLEEQLRQAQKMEAVGTLAGGIAHDFNNLLAAIIGFSQMALDSAAEGSRQERQLRRVLQAGMRARDLVKQILAFSRKAERQDSLLQVSEIVEEGINLLRASLPSTIDVRFNVESESDSIVADPNQIEQVLMNLCTNAAHAMRDRGILRVTLSDFSFASRSDAPDPDLEPGMYMKLSVQDTGEGMSQEVMEHVFEPFFTTKKAGEGTGLGLSVVHGIVKNHDGAITVHSELGKGSRFDVYLPKSKGHILPEIDSPTIIPTGNESILFVDDEEALAEMGEEMLSELGYNVTACAAGDKALELLKKDPHAFDLVITDQTMPDLTGIELAGEILCLRNDIPIIVCTGFSHLVDADAAKRAGVRAFVMKPLTKKELAQAIRKALDE